MPTYQYVPSPHRVPSPPDPLRENCAHLFFPRTAPASSPQLTTPADTPPPPLRPPGRAGPPSSKIWTADVPFIEPALTTESKSSGRSRCSVGSSGQEGPPGVQNFSSLPRLMPPASPINSRSVVPIGASYCPGFLTRPDRE